MLKIGKIELPDVEPTAANISGSFDILTVGAKTDIDSYRNSFSSRSMALEFIYFKESKYEFIDDFIRVFQNEITKNESIIISYDGAKLFSGKNSAKCIISSYELNKIPGSPNILNVSLDIYYNPLDDSQSSVTKLSYVLCRESVLYSYPKTSPLYNIGWYSDWHDVEPPLGTVDTTLFNNPMNCSFNNYQFQIYQTFSAQGMAFKSGMPDERKLYFIAYDDAIIDGKETVIINNGLNYLKLDLSTLTAEIFQYLGKDNYGAITSPAIKIEVFGKDKVVSEPVVTSVNYDKMGYSVWVEISFKYNNNNGSLRIFTQFASAFDFLISYNGVDVRNPFFFSWEGNPIEKRNYCLNSTPTDLNSALQIESVSTDYKTCIGVSYEVPYIDRTKTSRTETFILNGKYPANRGFGASTRNGAPFYYQHLYDSAFCEVMLVPKSIPNNTELINAYLKMSWCFYPQVIESF
jgi:hypothetical protein